MHLGVHVIEAHSMSIFVIYLTVFCLEHNEYRWAQCRNKDARTSKHFKLLQNVIGQIRSKQRCRGSTIRHRSHRPYDVLDERRRIDVSVRGRAQEAAGGAAISGLTNAVNIWVFAARTRISRPLLLWRLKCGT